MTEKRKEKQTHIRHIRHNHAYLGSFGGSLLFSSNFGGFCFLLGCCLNGGLLLGGGLDGLGFVGGLFC
jgi:hypothetical protein